MAGGAVSAAVSSSDAGAPRVPDVSGAEIKTENHVMYGGVPGGEPISGSGAGESDTPVTDISNLIYDDDDAPPFDPDDDE
jgi:hypothetical protein